MSNELKCTPGDWYYIGPKVNEEIGGQTYFSIQAMKAEIVGNTYKIPGFYYPHSVQTTEEMEANVRIMTSAKDLYNALKKIHSECHKLLNRGTNEKLSVIDCLTIIGAIGETCEPSLKKANPDFKP